MDCVLAGTSPKRMTSTGRCMREAHRPLLRLETAVTVSSLMILLVEMPSGNEKAFRAMISIYFCSA